MLQPVRLKLLGRFGLWQGDKEMPRLPRKTQALLAFLALEQDRHITREAVAELLWPDRGTKQARHSLRQTLLTLSKAVSGQSRPSSRMTTGWLLHRMSSSTRSSCDACRGMQPVTN